jgi:hypothetical protein
MQRVFIDFDPSIEDGVPRNQKTAIILDPLPNVIVYSNKVFMRVEDVSFENEGMVPLYNYINFYDNVILSREVAVLHLED